MSSTIMKYSEAFKLQVVEELETGRFASPREASHAYGIKGKNTVASWVRQYGKSHLLKKVVRVEKAGEPGELRRQKERTRQLESLVADLMMDRSLEKAAFNMVCEQQGIDPEVFKKKLVAKGSLKPTKSSAGLKE